MKGETSIIEFIQKFPDENACIKFVEDCLWPDGNIVSPFGDKGAYRISTRPGIYKCKANRRNFSIRYGTIFEESRLPFMKWFFAIHLLQSLKKGISSVQIAKTVGVTQKSAWFMLHRIRWAVTTGDFRRPLDGIVEIDEAYMGGVGSSKSTVVGMVERGGDIRLDVVPDSGKETLGNVVKDNVDLDKACVVTDEWRGYNGLGASEHHRINHSLKQYAIGAVHTNTIEGFWSHFKNGIKAIQIHVSGKHLHRYCQEYEFRYNHRDVSDFARFQSWMKQCSGRLTYAALIHEEGKTSQVAG